MNRMHPQDLRANFAMEFYKLAALADETEETTRDQTIKWAVSSADLLMAELERTAKPEPDPELTTWKAMAKAEGAREARARLRPWIRHHPNCLQGDACECGLRAALKAEP